MCLCFYFIYFYLFYSLIYSFLILSDLFIYFSYYLPAFTLMVFYDYPNLFWIKCVTKFDYLLVSGSIFATPWVSF